jgi:hypothetical protein
VATLAARLGWSYDTLMAMTTAERRLWLAASDNVGAEHTPRDRIASPGPVPAVGAGTGEHASGPAWAAAPVGPAGAAAPVGPGRLSTEDERRARLVELLEEMTARRRRP